MNISMNNPFQWRSPLSVNFISQMNFSSSTYMPPYLCTSGNLSHCSEQTETLCKCSVHLSIQWVCFLDALCLKLLLMLRCFVSAKQMDFLSYVLQYFFTSGNWSHCSEQTVRNCVDFFFLSIYFYLQTHPYTHRNVHLAPHTISFIHYCTLSHIFSHSNPSPFPNNHTC